MSDMLPREVQEGLDEARKRARRAARRTRVRMGDELFAIRDLHAGGFLMDRLSDRRLRGHVDIYDGARHLCRALIVASAEEGDAMRYEFKQTTQVTDAPAADYPRDPDAPAGLIGQV